MTKMTKGLALHRLRCWLLKAIAGKCTVILNANLSMIAKEDMPKDYSFTIGDVVYGDMQNAFFCNLSYGNSATHMLLIEQNKGKLRWPSQI